jgi:hypothetical protein
LALRAFSDPVGSYIAFFATPPTHYVIALLIVYIGSGDVVNLLYACQIYGPVSIHAQVDSFLFRKNKNRDAPHADGPHQACTHLFPLLPAARGVLSTINLIRLRPLQYTQRTIAKKLFAESRRAGTPLESHHLCQFKHLNS